MFQSTLVRPFSGVPTLVLALSLARRCAMHRGWMNYANDVLLLLTGTLLAVSSLLVWVVLPKGYNAPWLLWLSLIHI